MKVWKLVSGILSIVLGVFVIFQSGAAGLSNALEGSSEVSGTAGLFVAMLMIAGGIVSIATRKNIKKRCGIATAILFGLGGLVGLVGAGSYTDLRIWAIWCLVCTVLAIVSIVRKKSC